MVVRFKEREVEIDQLTGTIDEPLVEVAYYLDGDEEELTDEEKDDLLEHCEDAIYQEMYERAVSRAEDVYDFINDR